MSKDLGEWLASQPEPTPAMFVAPQPAATPPAKPRQPRLWIILGAALITLIVAGVIVLLTLNRPNDGDAAATLQRIDTTQQQLAEVNADITAAELLIAVQQQELRDLRAQIEPLNGAHESALPKNEKDTLGTSVNKMLTTVPAVASSEDTVAIQRVTAGAGTATTPAPLTWLDATLEQMRSYLAIEPVVEPSRAAALNTTAEDSEAEVTAARTEHTQRTELRDELLQQTQDHSRIATQLSTDLVTIGSQLPERARVIAEANALVPEAHQPIYDASDRAAALANAVEVVRLVDGQVRLPAEVPEVPADAVVTPLTPAKRAQLLLGTVQGFADSVGVVVDAQAVAVAAPGATAVIPVPAVPAPSEAAPPVVDGGDPVLAPGTGAGGAVSPVVPDPAPSGGSGGAQSGDAGGGSADVS